MEESRLIFLFEERQVEFRSVLEIGAQVLVAFDAHDRVHWCARLGHLLLAGHNQPNLINRILLINAGKTIVDKLFDKLMRAYNH